jgi:DNA-directed RNA polymerase I subunit RPA1
MTIRGRFFTRDQYQQLVYYALVGQKGAIKTLPPAIVKPGPFWSGKQIISTIIMNLVPEVSFRFYSFILSAKVNT